MAEDDWDGWAALTERARQAGSSSSATTSSSPTRAILQRGIDAGVANSILIKLNQIGTLTETLDAIAHGARGRLHGGHLAPLRRDRGRDDRRPRGRDGGCGQIKTGAPSRTERVAKYNQLLRIEEELGPKADYPGRRAFRQAAADGPSRRGVTARAVLCGPGGARRRA